MAFDWILVLLKLPVTTAQFVVGRFGFVGNRTNRVVEVRRADEAGTSLVARRSVSHLDAQRSLDRHRLDVAIEREVVICSHRQLSET